MVRDETGHVGTFDGRCASVSHVILANAQGQPLFPGLQPQ
jgi:hypothetical protein